MTRLRLPVLLLVGLVLAGCGSEPVPDQLAAPAVLPSPSPSPSASATPTAEAAPPLAATAQSEVTVPATEPSPPVEGNPSAAEVAEVERFVRDYYAAADRALVTGDFAPVESHFIPQCEYCRNDVNFTRENRALGTIEGSRTVIRSVTVQSIGPEMASVFVDMVTPDGRIVGPTGETVAVINNGDGGSAVHALFRTADGWKIAQVLEQ